MGLGSKVRSFVSKCKTCFYLMKDTLSTGVVLALDRLSCLTTSKVYDALL